MDKSIIHVSFAFKYVIEVLIPSLLRKQDSTSHELAEVFVKAVSEAYDKNLHKKQYVIDEGDYYYTISEDGKLVESVWDNESVKMHANGVGQYNTIYAVDEDTGRLFITREDEINFLL